ncbi:tetratricopeptide repeat protein [Streptomyces sp. NPDC052701]|uniref:tetratricopeptide repeat protein n=1 Tax=Streptomyces sp. NPDC052701 TaxID=3155533 RepID=UPI003416ED51
MGNHVNTAGGESADRRQGQVEQARALAEDTLARRRRVLGEDHPDTLATARLLEGLEQPAVEPRRAEAEHGHAARHEGHR